MGAPVQVRRYCYAEMFMTATFGNYGRVNRNCHLVISRSLPADHLNVKNTWSDHDSIHAHRNLNYTDCFAIARHRNFNAPKICKITVVSIGLLYPNVLLVLELASSQDVQSRSSQMQWKPGGVRFSKRSQRDGACAHCVMVSKFQWKPFWLDPARSRE